MENDETVGRILSRREMLALLGGAGVAMLTGCNTSGETENAATNVSTQTSSTQKAAPANTACVARPEMTEGPYFVDKQLERSDIRREPSDKKVKAGVPLFLTFNVSSLENGACKALPAATVDVWNCDAQGVYSAVNEQGGDTRAKKFLRGFQKTDTNGIARFTTIIPGWYRGRTVHIHFKIRTKGADGKDYEFTSQLYLDDDFTKKVFAKAPYGRSGQRDTFNSNDMHFARGGEQMLLNVKPQGEGYAATFAVALDLSDTKIGASDAEMRGGPPGSDGFPGGPPPDGPPPGGMPPGGRPPLPR